MRTATLQASPDGLSVYVWMGFRRLATLRAFVRTTARDPRLYRGQVLTCAADTMAP